MTPWHSLDAAMFGLFALRSSAAFERVLAECPRVRAGVSGAEFSVTLYHEVLEAAAVASEDPLTSVTEFNERDFERAAYAAHEQFGPASLENLNRILQAYNFQATI
jgi:hypothetical protein